MGYHREREEIALFPRPRSVGEKTESTVSEGGVQPGGGSFLAAAHADTEGFFSFSNDRV